ncbi:MAG: hypothetical protein ABI042_12180 [Verrucomicrobiota bacterium]
MGLFNKKADPISERAKALNAEIAALEAKIKKIGAQPVPPSTQPRVRSSSFPPGSTSPRVPSPPTSREPIFEKVDQNRLQATAPAVAPEQFNQLGVKKYDLLSFFSRWKNNFRSRPTANPKLVSYLAAGSIQGLRPLRYEKRVARNRFLVLAAILLLVSWGIAAMFWKHH